MRGMRIRPEMHCVNENESSLSEKVKCSFIFAVLEVGSTKAVRPRLRSTSPTSSLPTSRIATPGFSPGVFFSVKGPERISSLRVKMIRSPPSEAIDLMRVGRWGLSAPQMSVEHGRQVRRQLVFVHHAPIRRPGVSSGTCEFRCAAAMVGMI